MNVEDLVDEPVEPKGILSRIEQHVAGLKQYLHGALSEPSEPGALPMHMLLHEIRSIADHDAQIGAGRQEFLRAYLTTMQQDITTIKATLQVILEAQQVYNTTLAKIGTQMYASESKDRSLTKLVELQRRVSALEKRDDREGSETTGEQQAG